MKAIGLYKYGGPEVLEMVEVPVPEISDDEVLVKVVTASVNPVDWKVRKGNLKFLTGNNFPFIPGTEVAGFVDKTGKNTGQFEKGQRVYAGLSYKGGGYAEYVNSHLRIVGTDDMRDKKAIERLATGYLKLLFPDLKLSPMEFEQYCIEPSVMLRQAIRDQLSKMDPEYKVVTIEGKAI